MVGNGRDPLDVVKRLAESYTNIRFGSGVVGKTSYATIGLFFLWAIILIRLTDSLWFDIALLSGGAVATGIYFWWVRKTQEFAEKNPDLALLEGAQLIEYQKWQAEVKGYPLPQVTLITDPHALPPARGNAELR